MQFTRIPSNTTRLALILLLATSVLFSQFVGVIHRVAHGGPSGPVSLQLGAPSPVQQLIAGWTHSAHSCAAFDAATLADTVNSAVLLVPALPNLHVLALWIVPASRLTPFELRFLSRAPPAV